MANYFQDPSQSFVPTTTYHPNFDALQSNMMIKQGQYDQGLASVQSAESSVFNAPLTNGLLVDQRAQYVKAAKQQIGDLSQVDLSQQENQQKARSVYSSFFNNPDMVQDMAWTSNNRQQISTGLSMRDSQDEKIRNGYWDAGIVDLTNQAEDVRNAKMVNGHVAPGVYVERKYVPNKDISAYMDKSIKDANFKPVFITGMNGPQLITTSGGADKIPMFRSFLAGVVGNQFDDIFGVLGRNENHARYNQAIASGSTPENARDMVAKNFITDSTNNLLASIATNDGQIQNQDEIIKMSTDADGYHDPKLYPAWKAAVAKKNELSVQQTSLNKSLKGLQDATSTDYQQMYHTIFTKGDEFFGNTYRDKTIGNYATALSMNIEQKVENNDAYDKQRTYDLAERRLAFDIAKEKETARVDESKIDLNEHKAGNFLNADGTENIGSAGTGASSGSGSTGTAKYNAATAKPDDLGYATKDVLDRPITLDNVNEQLSAQFQGANEMIIKGIAAYLPAMGLDIDPMQAAEFASAMTANYKDLKSHHTPVSIAVADKLYKFLENKQIKTPEGCPSCFLSNVKDQLFKVIADNSKKGVPLTEDQISLVTSNIENGYSQLQEYHAKKDQIAKYVHNGILEKLKGSDKDSWNKYTRINPDTKQREFVDKPSLKELPDITGVDESSSTGLKWLGNQFVHPGDNTTLSGKDFAKKFNNNEISIVHEYGENANDLGILYSVNGGPKIEVRDKAQVYAILQLQDEKKKFDTFIEKGREVSDPAAALMQGAAKDGIIGHELLYPITPAKADKEASKGSRLIAEVSNPGNFAAINGLDKTSSKYNTLMQALRGKNVDMVSAVSYNPSTRKVNLTFDPTKLNKKEGSDYGLSEADIVTLTSTGMSISLENNASGTVINQLPEANTFQKYDQLMNGKSVSSSEIQNGYGYKYTIYPNNMGIKGTKPTSLNIKMDVKKYIPTPNPIEGGPVIWQWVTDKEQSKTIRDIPLQGKNAKTADDLVEFAESGWAPHLRLNNNNMTIHDQQTAATSLPIKQTEQEFLNSPEFLNQPKN